LTDTLTIKRARSWTGVLKIHSYDRDLTLKEENIESSLSVLLQDFIDREVRLTVQDIGPPTEIKPVVVWVKEHPSTAKIIWVPRDATPMGIKDQACKEEGFNWAQYESLKAKTLK